MDLRRVICALGLFWLGLSAVAWAAPVAPINEVDQARAKLRTLRTEQAKLRADKARLDAQYQDKLSEIDRLKKQRASWRRDRLIRSHMSESHGTAERLSGLDQRLRRLSVAIDKQEQAVVRAIDRELGANPSAARAQKLRAWRRSASADTHQRSAKKIILPEDEIDPLADPEELEYQASLLRQSEEQLAREIAKLEHQARRYRHMVSLRKKFRRADELAHFDDDRPRRGNGRAGDRAGADADAGNPPPASPPPAPPPPPPSSDPTPGTEQPPAGPPDNDTGSDNLGGEGEFSSADLAFDIVLADVVDASTVKALRAAGSSSDPAVKAQAAEQARAQVQARIERLRKRRKLMQKRAKRLRDRP